MDIISFIDEYLAILGLTGQEADEYRAKVVYAAAGKALIELDDDPATHDRLAQTIAEAASTDEPFDELLGRAFPDGRHMRVFLKRVLDVLLRATADAVSASDESTIEELGQLVRSVTLHDDGQDAGTVVK